MHLALAKVEQICLVKDCMESSFLSSRDKQEEETLVEQTVI